jgi:hypothetical protein
MNAERKLSAGWQIVECIIRDGGKVPSWAMHADIDFAIKDADAQATTADQKSNSDDKLADFLREMTELARKYQMGIAGPFDIFEMDADDSERKYREDGRGKWEFI